MEYIYSQESFRLKYLPWALDMAYPFTRTNVSLDLPHHQQVHKNYMQFGTYQVLTRHRDKTCLSDKDVKNKNK